MRSLRRCVTVSLFAVLALCVSSRLAHAVCGDGTLEVGEICDDGNLVDGDGCDSNCTPTGCGNGIITAPEACDDGNVVDGDGCDSNCTVTSCGNGIVTAGEACDDGNIVSGDGCDADCSISGCGNGVVAGPEICDDGNLVDGDGCDSTCKPTGCGSGIVTGTEQCDDGNTIDGDGCSSTCQRELLNPVPAAGDLFGSSLAASGGNVIVGVPRHDQGTAEETLIDTGLVYLYSGSTFQPIRTFQNPTADPGDEFGFAVAAVGSDILIGAPRDNTVATEAGAAYLFDATTGALKTTFLNPNPNGSKHFGWSLAVRPDKSIVIGAPSDASGLLGGGVAYLFSRTGQLQQVFINPVPSADEDFGAVVAAFGDDVVVGAPGHDKVAVGFEQGGEDSGAVYIFDAATGVPVKTIENPLPAPGDRFGHAVAILGPELLVAAPFRQGGVVYRIDPTTGSALPPSYLPPPPVGDDLFGWSVTAADGKIVIGAIRGNTLSLLNPGTVYVFDAGTHSLLQTLTKASPAVGDEFGRAVTISGSSIVVGAPRDDTRELDAGAVYFFPNNSCGNGTVDPSEQCDDGNPVSGDGCDANCAVTACGNGVVTAPEQCDDGNTIAGDGCSPTCSLEGACGDGIQSAFEECDDGNLVSGDGCDANCTITSCGNGVIAAPEQCDNGALNGADLCCSSACQLIDADHDGICDRDDACPNTTDPLQQNSDGDVFGDACDICPMDINNDSDGDLFCTGPSFNLPAVGGGDPCSRADGAGEWSAAKAIFSYLGDTPGDDRMRLRGRFTVGTLLPKIDPAINGIHVRVINTRGDVIVDQEIPGGKFTPDSPRGWKVLGSERNKWVYTDRTKPPLLGGIGKIIIKNLLFVDPKLFTVAVHGDLATYQLKPGDEPIRVSVELNEHALPAGGTPGRDQCGEAQFLKTGKPTCKFLWTRLSCK